MITTADFRAHSAIPDDENDALLQQKIDAATAWTAKYLGVELDNAALDDATVREAVLQLAGHLYENREASLVGVTAATIPFGVTDLLAPHRTWSF